MARRCPRHSLSHASSPPRPQVTIAALAFSGSDPPFSDPCAPATDCTDCIAKVSQGCGWCAPHEVVYTDGTKGNRCANSHDPKKWFCLGKLQTD